MCKFSLSLLHTNTWTVHIQWNVCRGDILSFMKFVICDNTACALYSKSCSVCWGALASFPGHAQLSVLCSIKSRFLIHVWGRSLEQGQGWSTILSMQTDS